VQCADGFRARGLVRVLAPSARDFKLSTGITDNAVGQRMQQAAATRQAAFETLESCLSGQAVLDFLVIYIYSEDISGAITHFGASVQSNYTEHPI
jgi:hypothetical protein